MGGLAVGLNQVQGLRPNWLDIETAGNEHRGSQNKVLSKHGFNS